ncbi:hypothetical protein G6F68_016120 [Rhizopus microsporus]|nr:hypothetical protein G6F68_016120 [Rhizopus microsporus]
MRRQRATGTVQQEQHDEAAFAEPMWRQPAGAVVIDRRGQRQQLEAQPQQGDIAVATSLCFLQQGMVPGFDHRSHDYD